VQNNPADAPRPEVFSRVSWIFSPLFSFPLAVSFGGDFCCHSSCFILLSFVKNTFPISKEIHDGNNRPAPPVSAVCPLMSMNGRFYGIELTSPNRLVKTACSHEQANMAKSFHLSLTDQDIKGAPAERGPWRLSLTWTTDQNGELREECKPITCGNFLKSFDKCKISHPSAPFNLFLVGLWLTQHLY
jgi:hypothetical protein